jgi:DNA-binding Xre family transcriptional regulator
VRIDPTKFKIALARARLRQRDLSDAVGIDETVLSSTIAGRKKPRVGLIEQLAIALGCDAGDLLVEEAVNG